MRHELLCLHRGLQWETWESDAKVPGKTQGGYTPRQGQHQQEGNLRTAKLCQTLGISIQQKSDPRQSPWQLLSQAVAAEAAEAAGAAETAEAAETAIAVEV